MSRIGNDYLGALKVVTTSVIGTNGHQPRELAMSTCTRIERELAHARNG